MIIAGVLNTSRINFGKIELGKRQTIPSVEQIQRIATMLETKPEYLLNGTDSFFANFTKKNKKN